MSVLLHMKPKVQVWDGYSFDYVSPTKAKKLVKAGTHQISSGLQAKDLKRPEEFSPVEDKVVKKSEYATKVMEAE